MNKLRYLLLLLTSPLFAQSVSINGVPNQTFVGPSGTPQYIAPQAIAGCGVEYVSGLTYTVGACTYSINGVTYNSPLSNITLPAADATNPKIDVIFVDTTGVVQVIQGTPGVTPQQPVVDPSTQLQLTFVLVPATATTPANTTAVLIYDENVEWTSAKGGTSSANVNLASTNNPYHGTIDTEFGAGGAVASTTFAQYTKPAAGTVTLGSYNTLTLYLRNKAAWPKSRSITVQWFNGAAPLGTAVVLSNGAYGLDATGNITSYQQISIPTSTFGIAGTPATTVKFTVSGSGANLTGFYLDQVTLQGGNGGVVLPTTLMNYRGSWNTTATYSPNDTVVSGGIGYVALAANTNVAVTTTATWSPLAPAGGSGNTTSTSLTTNSLPKANGANSIINSLFTDNGTGGAYTGTGGFSAPAFLGTGSDHYLNIPSSPSHTAVISDLYNNAGTLIWCPSGSCVNLYPLGLTSLAAQAADTVVANASGSSAAPTAVTIPSCSGASSALTYSTTTHTLGCNTISGGSSGSLVLLEEHTASTSILAFNTRNVAGQSGASFQSDFDTYQMTCVNIVPVSTNTQVFGQVSSNGGSTYDTGSTNYGYSDFRVNSSGGTAGIGSPSLGILVIASPDSALSNNSAWGGLNTTFQIYNPLSTTAIKAFTGSGMYYEGGGNLVAHTFSTSYTVSGTAFNSFKIFPGVGTNFTSGTCRLYGIAK